MSAKETNNCTELKRDLAQAKTIAGAFYGIYRTAVEKNEFMEAREFLDNLGNRLMKLRNKLEPQIFSELRITESQKLSEFFGRPTSVPKLPEEITVARLEKWREQGFELHYLPATKMSHNRKFPGWKQKTDEKFNDLIKKGLIPADADDLRAGWVLIDGIAKPEIAWRQLPVYENDIFENALNKLRERECIFMNLYPNVVDAQAAATSRYLISAEELDKPEVKAVLAEVLGVGTEQFGLPRIVEYNVLGNIHHPEWGDANSEWMADKRLADAANGFPAQNVFCGSSAKEHFWRTNKDGLSNIGFLRPDWRNDNIGFRPLIRFSEKTKRDNNFDRT